MTEVERVERRIKQTNKTCIILKISVSIVFLWLIAQCIVNHFQEELMLFFSIFFIIAWILIMRAIGEVKKQLIQVLEEDLKNEKLKLTIPEEFHLSFDEFVEVKWNEKNDDIFPISLKIMKKYGMKFLVKLISKDEILLIIQDRDGDELLEPKTIHDFIFFNENFEPKF